MDLSKPTPPEDEPSPTSRVATARHGGASLWRDPRVVAAVIAASGGVLAAVVPVVYDLWQ
ncbi:hypothetical protein Ait01nite_049790 [Actinoplanes italicus]|uniref:Uncharacterized protein n=1 Tax=Actinoplanes italicus TaxID=113567 RepID=A0A2T0KAD5_9ACTN|nr:hypothetical protein CLV67_109345 [Actinoplanes italicus]GIE31934.1 hypothetical protein Ait01nite_049790 [Actinoplanes italicus]